MLLCFEYDISSFDITLKLLTSIHYITQDVVVIAMLKKALCNRFLFLKRGSVTCTCIVYL